MFRIENVNREASIAVDINPEKGKLFTIPKVGEVKEYGEKNNLPYSVPRFVGDNHYYICTHYKGKHKQDIWTTQLNPVILSTNAKSAAGDTSTGLVYVEETQHGVEGTYLVPRHPRILAAWTNAQGLEPVQKELIGLAALQFQQAIHAAQGLFISDWGLRIDNNKEYQEGTDEQRKEIIDNYFKALKESLAEEINENKDTADYLKATEFLADNISKNNIKEFGVLPEWVERELAKEEKEALKK